jgi:type IV pilus assembly protein PilA
VKITLHGTKVHGFTENKAVLEASAGTKVTFSLVRQVQTSSPTASFAESILKQTQRGEIKEMRKQKGFSLIELLIVVAIILIIAAIAIPNLLRARMAANESSAVGSVRTLNTGEITYNTTYPTIGFTQTLLSLGGALGAACTPSSTSACLIDSVLANNGNPSGSGKSGYSFLIAGGAAQAGGVYVQYDINAQPLTINQTGIRSFCAVEDAVVRVNPLGAAVGGETACQGMNPLNQ